MDALLTGLAAIRQTLPEGLRDRAGDGDFALAVVIILVAVLIGLVSIAVGVLKKGVTNFFEKLGAAGFVLLALHVATIFVAALVNRVWLVVPVVVLAGLGLAWPPTLVRLLQQPWAIVAQVVLLVIVGYAEGRVVERQNAGKHYYVVLPLRPPLTETTDDRVLHLSGVYLDRHRDLFGEIKTIQILPHDSRQLKDLRFHDADRPKIPLRVRALMRRERFCPAVVLTATVHERPPLLVLRAGLEGVGATSRKLEEIDHITLQGNEDMEYVTLKATVELLRRLRALRCDVELGPVQTNEGRPAVSAGSMALDPAAEAAIRHRVLERYGRMLDLSGEPRVEPLAAEVAAAVRAERFDEASVEALLDRYPHLLAQRPSEETIEVKRQANTAKLPGAFR